MVSLYLFDLTALLRLTQLSPQLLVECVRAWATSQSFPFPFFQFLFQESGERFLIGIWQLLNAINHCTQAIIHIRAPLSSAFNMTQTAYSIVHGRMLGKVAPGRIVVSYP